MSLVKTLTQGVKWTALDSTCSAIIQLVRVFILTKLLSASDFGLMALVLIVTGFSQMFVDFGLSNAIIYKSKNSNEQLSTLYWINVMLGVFTCFIILIISYPIASFIFKEGRLNSILRIVSFTFAFNGFAVQYKALLSKKLEFRTLAQINIITPLIGFIVTIILAYKGYGVYSLVIGYMVENMLRGTLFITYGIKYHKPQWYFNIKEVNSYLQFGGYQLSERIITYFRQQGDNVLIGTFLSTETLGFYNLAKILVMKPVQLIRSVFNKMAFPVYSAIKDDKQLKFMALTVNKIVYLAIIPIMLLLIAFPDVVIYHFYGEKWMESLPYLQTLAILFSIRLFRATFGPLLLARGKAKQSFLFNLWFSLLVFMALAFGLQFSILHALYGLILMELFVFQAMNFKMILKPVLDFGAKDYLKAVLSSFLPLFFSAIITTITYQVFSKKTSLLINLGIYLSGLCIGIALFYILNRESVKNITTMLSKFKKEK
ncbi:MOP flippase family protein [Pseudotamlana agarivorans]|uniref:MOP flippase family protein n=1 Tax=Pseudotamlana agarivorans TaxID=481183 RepID=UPI000A43C676|nr:MOP flippase family protein [Tamlana agarivorans]